MTSLEAQGDQVLLHSLSAARHRRHRRRADGKACSGCSANCSTPSRLSPRGPGTPAAFFSTDDGRDIQPGLIDYVADFVTVAAGDKFNPHVTIGVAPQTYLDKMFTEPFKAFTFSPVGAAVYQLGTFGAVRKELQTLTHAP